jgi:hypothetical protein
LFNERKKLIMEIGCVLSSFCVFQGEVEFDVGADEVVAEGVGEETGGSGSAEGVSDGKIPPALPVLQYCGRQAL